MIYDASLPITDHKCMHLAIFNIGNPALELVAAAKIELPRTHSNIAFRQFRSVEVLLERRVLWHRL